jgi:hypothetical protein
MNLMNIDFLAAELERRGRAGAHPAPKAQHALIEAQRSFKAVDGQDHMVDMVDNDAIFDHTPC